MIIVFYILIGALVYSWLLIKKDASLDGELLNSSRWFWVVLLPSIIFLWPLILIRKYSQ